MTVEQLLVNLFAVVIYAIILCFVNEALCDWLFATDQYERLRLNGKGLKGIIAGAFAVGIVFVGGFDAINMVQGLPATNAGKLFSSGLVAGGSGKLAVRFERLGMSLKSIRGE